MNDTQPWQGERPLPAFFVEWRKGWRPGGEGFTPMNYFVEEAAIPAVFMAAWLFYPETTEHRGGVFLTERLDPAVADEWFTQFEGNIAAVERKVNMLVLYDLFGSADLDAYSDAELRQLAEAIAGCWRGVLAQRFPNRTFRVDVSDDDDSYGPTVTFWSA